ncbi:MAG: hypothetical protein ABI222_12625 [Opitutaceae bacterium]
MNPAPSASAEQGGMAGRWLWFLGVTGIVFAARLRELHLHGSETPSLDQWDVEARQILVPWLQGKLSWTAFFTPHNEHVPAWTRLLAWLQAALLGRWDPQLQATFNAVLHGVFVGAFSSWLRRALPLAPALGLTVLAVVLAALPFGWENSVWGFQAHTPLALLFVFWHIHGSFTRRPGSTAWWLAQAAGLAGLFTYGSMWAAPAAVVATALWTAAPDRRRWIVPALITAGGIALMLFARSRQAPVHTLTLTAHTPQEFLASFLLQLGWPAAWPGACVLLFVPSFLLALQLRRRAAAENFDRVVLALAVWAAAQAAAFAYGRGGGYFGFVSRYGDLLALGVAANGIALWRLVQGTRAWRLGPAALLALVWLLAVSQGLREITTRGHTLYFHEHSELWALFRRDAVRHYLATKDLAALSTPEVREVLYPDPQGVASVLDQPGLVALLPVSLRPHATRVRGDFVSAIDSRVRTLWAAFAASGIVLLLLAAWLVRGHPLPPVPTFAYAADPWRVPLLGLLALASGCLVFLWPKPFEFSAEKRWLALLAPRGTVEGLTWHITTETTFDKDNLTGGANLLPGEFRNLFYGTHIDGPSFIGSAQSSLFPIKSPWLVIPYAGFPVSPGNALLLRIEDASGKTLAELACPGPNPAFNAIDFWAVDVRAFSGRSARLVFHDGRNDAEGWIAAAPPQAVKGPERAASFRRDRASEPTRFGQASLGIMALASLLLAALAAFFSRRRKA